MGNNDYTKYEYEFEINNKKITNIFSNNQETKFQKPVTEKKLKKLYIIIFKKEIIYIGITNQSIRNRLRMGINPKKNKTGYHGYKWKDIEGKFKILIYTFNREINLEGIEAEIVYNFRSKNNKWPKYQHEIHFHNIKEEEKDIASSIFIEASK